jgi:UDP-2,3-diacylglucosamine pyrophosphatase LpxH
MIDELAAILRTCEETGLARPYVAQDPGDSTDLTTTPGVILEYSSDGGTVLAVSDLHLASGRGADGAFDGCENFFADDSFQRFLIDAHHKSPEGKHHTLILNGDTIDFLRVTYVPGRPQAPKGLQRLLMQLKLRHRANRLRAMNNEARQELDDDFEQWRQLLLRVGIDMTVEQLNASIVDKEELYGLRTEDFKSVLRLDIVMKGHPAFFEALAYWLVLGNRLLVVKGNHDLEWFWLAVRNLLRRDLAERVARALEIEPKAALLETVLPNVTFADHAVLIDGEVYLEHGHPYDPVTRVIGANTVREGHELNIPMGSFFNRYVLDMIELQQPYIDNIRPTANILPVLLRQDGFAGLRMLFNHIVFVLKTVPRRYVHFVFGKNLIGRAIAIALAALVPPIALIVYQIWAKPALPIGVLEWVATLLVVHFLIQALAKFQLDEPDSLSRFARLRFAENPNYRLMTMGHTHNPSQFREGERWFYNTGTWIPIIEVTTAEVRTDRTFTFVRLDHEEGALQPTLLQRWDDEAGRAEPMTLIRGNEN